MRKAPTMEREQTGQAMVEFLLSLIVLMVFVFFCFEMFMMVYSYNVLADAAKEGVRFAIVNGSNSGTPAGPAAGATSDCSTNVSSVQNVVRQYGFLTFHNTSGMTVNVCYLDGNNKAPSRVQVTVHYAYQPYFKLPLTPTINAAAMGRIVN
jgi:Flp pilus assembly protein TadG